MTATYYRQKIQDSSKKIAGFQTDRGKATAKIAKLQQDINKARSTIRSTSSSSTVNSKLREIARYESQVADCHKTLASIEDKLGKEETRRAQHSKALATAEDKEARKRHEDQKRLQEEQKKNERRHQLQLRALSNQVSQHGRLHGEAFTMIEQLRALPEELVVLFLAANPANSSRLRLDEEVRSIAEMIRKSEFRDSVKLVSRWAARPLDILQAINEDRPHVIHFSGHGSKDGLLFQDEAGGSKMVTTEAMVQVMASTSRDLRLVVFNSCESSAQAAAVVDHVEAAVGMKQSIRDDAARVFAAYLYSAIGFGLSLAEAFGQAKSALLLEGIPQHDVPEIYTRAGVEAGEIILVRPPNLE